MFKLVQIPWNANYEFKRYTIYENAF